MKGGRLLTKLVDLITNKVMKPKFKAIKHDSENLSDDEVTFIHRTYDTYRKLLNRPYIKLEVMAQNGYKLHERYGPRATVKDFRYLRYDFKDKDGNEYQTNVVLIISDNVKAKDDTLRIKMYYVTTTSSKIIPYYTQGEANLNNSRNITIKSEAIDEFIKHINNAIEKNKEVQKLYEEVKDTIYPIDFKVEKKPTSNEKPKLITITALKDHIEKFSTLIDTKDRSITSKFKEEYDSIQKDFEHSNK